MLHTAYRESTSYGTVMFNKLTTSFLDFIHTVRISYAAEYMQRTGVRPSGVRPSVYLSGHSPAALRCCGFSAVRQPVGDIDRLLHGRRSVMITPLPLIYLQLQASVRPAEKYITRDHRDIARKQQQKRKWPLAKDSAVIVTSDDYREKIMEQMGRFFVCHIVE